VFCRLCCSEASGRAGVVLVLRLASSIIDTKNEEKDGLFDFAPFTFLVLLLLLALMAGES
jgi:hypothetical protein